MTILNFKCVKCNNEFDFNAGKISNFVNKRFIMENEPTCPLCGNTEEANIIVSEKNDSKIQELLNKEARKKAIRKYRPGELMSYVAIFGGGEIFRIEFKNESYKVADYYCVAPNCDCKEIILHSFLANSNLDEPIRRLAYNYDLDKLTECENISEQDAQEIIKILKISDKEIFLKRHMALKKELRHCLHNKFFKNKKSSRKIGRNEQCPCGSGKKYKKCCLNKKEQ